jgi:hypothetical protein
LPEGSFWWRWSSEPWCSFEAEIMARRSRWRPSRRHRPWHLLSFLRHHYSR